MKREKTFILIDIYDTVANAQVEYSWRGCLRNHGDGYLRALDVLEEEVKGDKELTQAVYKARKSIQEII